jgi:hypothetical protein
MFAKFVGTSLALVVAAFGQQASGQATVATASWAADDGSDNRDGGSMNDIGATINGGSNYVRFRTGGAPSFTTTLTLGSATSIAGVSVMVDESPDAEGEGYSGIEITVDGTAVYNRYEMFGNYERSAQHEAPAADFAIGVPTSHCFDAPVSQLTSPYPTALSAFDAPVSGDTGDGDHGHDQDVPRGHLRRQLHHLQQHLCRH